MKLTIAAATAAENTVSRKLARRAAKGSVSITGWLSTTSVFCRPVRQCYKPFYPARYGHRDLPPLHPRAFSCNKSNYKGSRHLVLPKRVVLTEGARRSRDPVEPHVVSLSTWLLLRNAYTVWPLSAPPRRLRSRRRRYRSERRDPRSRRADDPVLRWMGARGVR
jgi:hypothetical protein